MAAFDLEATYLAIDGEGEVLELPVGPDFWATIDTSPVATRSLVAVFPTRTDWPHWEMHPSGAEVLVLIDGRVEMLLDDGASIRNAVMEAGATLVVPPGTWHRALVRAPGRMLAITYGPGTEHRPA